MGSNFLSDVVIKNRQLVINLLNGLRRITEMFSTTFAAKNNHAISRNPSILHFVSLVHPLILD